MMDWDLEAPGLHRYFEGRSERAESFDRPGVIDYFIALRERLVGEPALYDSICSVEESERFRLEFPLDDYIHRNVVPKVDLIKSGRLDAAYAESVNTFSWVDFHKNYGSALEPFREMLADEYDYILVDSRTGFNDVSGVCTMLIPETLVLVFTPNRQSLSGVIDLAMRATNYRRGSNDFRPLSVFPLPSRIENGEQQLKTNWRQQYQREFENALKQIYQLEKCDLTNYFDEVQLPQLPYYAYGEKIALLEQRSDALSLGRAYEEFFKKLISSNFAWSTSPTEPELSDQPFIEPQSFTPDLYISYSHIDNVSLVEGTRGWIDTFQETLQLRLSQLIGREVNILYDTKLQGNDYFSDALQPMISKANIFIAVLSPRYVRSEWCTNEIAEYTNLVSRDDQPKAIYKVVKSFVPIAEQPEYLQNFIGYEFFETDDSGRMREFRPDEQYAQESKYWAKLDDLAWDIKGTLEGHGRGILSTGASPLSVYLAETTSDLSFERDSIKRELHQRGLRVFPEKALPLDAAQLKEAIAADLKRCSLSVHLIGSRYGLIPEGEERSIVRLQSELATEYADGHGLKQMFWIPKDIEPAEDRQRQFIEGLLNGVTPVRNAEILRTTLADLKYQIVTNLERQARPQPQVKDKFHELTRIYLPVHRVDMDKASACRSYLFDRGYEVMLPAVEGDAKELREDHKENLLFCDAVLILVSSASEMWLRTILRDLQKLAGYGRTKPLLAKAIYLTEPLTPWKQSFLTHEALVIRDFDEFQPRVLEPFVSLLKAVEVDSDTGAK